MPIGVVKWFNDKKGYGFICPTDGSPDVFVHYSAIIDEGHKTLMEGDRVEFEIVQNGESRRARNVILLTREL